MDREEQELVKEKHCGSQAYPWRFVLRMHKISLTGMRKGDL